MTRRVDVVRVHEDPGRRRGERRVLVDRLWPRGVRKEAVDADDWCKDVAPSTELRKWYGHEPSRFATFSRRYRRELDAEPAATVVGELRRAADRGGVTLLTATRDVEHSAAAVLRDVLTGRRSSASR